MIEPDVEQAAVNDKNYNKNGGAKRCFFIDSE